MHETLQLVASILLTVITTAGTLHLWLKRGAIMPLDVANARSLHSGAIPRIGGIAMGIGFSIAYLVTGPEAGRLSVPLTIALALLLVSLLDDYRSLSILPRLTCHFAAATAFALLLPAPPALAAPIVLILVWMTNLYNFMDGSDGLAGGMAVFGFGAYAIAAWPADPGMATICLMLAGAGMAFLLFNAPPAKVFMGDAGSIPLGFLAGSLGLAGWNSGIWPFWFPALVFSPFIADATLTLLERIWRRERFWQAHRDHCYQRLILMGWSHRKLMLSAWSLMSATAGVALLLRHAEIRLAGAAATALAIAYLILFRTIGNRWSRATARSA